MQTLLRLFRKRWLQDLRRIELYPPFMMMGVKVKEMSEDHREALFTLPLKWWAKNMHGTQFGGFICAVTDPLPALMCGKIFPGTIYWTKYNAVEFHKPAQGTLYIKVKITEKDIHSIQSALDRDGKTVHYFEFECRDSSGTLIASVRNGVYVRTKS